MGSAKSPCILIPATSLEPRRMPQCQLPLAVSSYGQRFSQLLYTEPTASAPSVTDFKMFTSELLSVKNAGSRYILSALCGVILRSGGKKHRRIRRKPFLLSQARPTLMCCLPTCSAERRKICSKRRNSRRIGQYLPFTHIIYHKIWISSRKICHEIKKSLDILLFR